jgi:hypothetical protein
VNSVDYWRRDGREHLREEEEILLPTLAGSADPDARSSVRF